MKFIIKSKDAKVSEELDSYIQKKIGKLEKFFENTDPDLIQVDIEFSKAVGRQKQGEIFQADINFRVPGNFFRSSVRGENLFSIIDSAEEELETEIRKFKTKKETMFRRGARSLKKMRSISSFARFREKSPGGSDQK